MTEVIVNMTAVFIYLMPFDTCGSIMLQPIGE